jgi:PAS domain S-box-containing protein
MAQSRMGIANTKGPCAMADPLNRMNRLYETLSQINEAIVCVKTREELFTRVCQIAVEYGRFKVAWIGWLDTTSDVLIPVAKEGDDAGLVTGEFVSHCCCGLAVVRSGQPCVIDNLVTAPCEVGCGNTAETLGIRACAAYPIRLHNRVCGVLAVGTNEPCFFNDDAEARLLGQMTMNISFALDNLEAGRQCRETEDALRKGEQHLEAVLQSALDGFYLVDTQGKLLQVNDAYCAMSGYTREELLQMRLSDLESAETETDIAAHVQRIMLQGGDRFESCHRRKDGQVLNIESSVNFQNLDGGQFFCFLRDITQRKSAEKELQRNQERLTQAVGVAALGIFERDLECDRDQTALLCSPRLRKIFGWSADEPVTLDALRDRVLPMDREILATGIRRAVDPSGQGLNVSEYRIMRPDGIRWVSVRVQSFFEGEGELRRPVRTVGAVQDITGSKQVELELSESRQQLRTALDAAKLGFWSHNLITREIFQDERTRSIFGNHADKIISFEKLLSFVVPEDRVRFEHVVREQQEDADSNFEYRINLPDGGVRCLQARIGVIHDDSGRSIRAVGTVMDITEQKRAEHKMLALEQQFRQAQKMEAVGRLAGGIAHDFNNLLMVIQSYTEMLQESLPADDGSRRNTEQVLKAADRAASLTRQLLAFSRKQVLSSVVLDLNAVVGEAANMLKRLIGEDIDLRVNSAEALWTVKADPDQIAQVLMNLGINARDAMPTGGTLTIETSNVTMSEHLLEKYPYVPPGDYVFLSVTDTGTGISKEAQEQIFEPFFTTKELGKGTGLGLSTVFGIVKQSGGYVLVDSELGQGAYFAICLPRMKHAIAPATLAKSERAQGGTETLLVVEDEDALRDSICDFLRRLGYTLLASDSGPQALSIASQHEGVIDILITDVVLPRMGGRELSQTLARQRPELKTIYMSGYTDDAVLRNGVREEGVAFLQKPFGLSALASKVREILRPTDTLQ